MKILAAFFFLFFTKVKIKADNFFSFSVKNWRGSERAILMEYNGFMMY